MESKLSKSIQDLLSSQLQKEFESAYLYLQIADFYESKGLSGFASWFKVQAKEEEDHAMIFYNFLHQNNAEIKFEPIQPAALSFISLKAPLEKALKHEIYVTTSINKIYTQAVLENDYKTKCFLNWFIKEQMEEESTAQMLIDNFSLFALDENDHLCKTALLNLDRTYGKREYKPSKKLRSC